MYRKFKQCNTLVPKPFSSWRLKIETMSACDPESQVFGFCVDVIYDQFNQRVMFHVLLKDF